MNDNTKQSAFPLQGFAEGLTKREYAAIHIAAGMMCEVEGEVVDKRIFCARAVAFADTLFDELERK